MDEFLKLLPAIISAISSTLIFVLGIVLSNRSKRKERDLLKQQIHKLLEPIALQLLKPTASQLKIAEIIQSSYSIAPVEIAEHLNDLAAESADIQAFKEVALDQYNRIRKYAGYPYDDSFILPELNPKDLGLISYPKMVLGFLPVIAGLIALWLTIDGPMVISAAITLASFIYAGCIIAYLYRNGYMDWL